MDSYGDFRCPLILLLTCSLPNVTPSAPCRRVWEVFQAATVESAASGTDIYISCGFCRGCRV